MTLPILRHAGLTEIHGTAVELRRRFVDVVTRRVHVTSAGIQLNGDTGNPIEDCQPTARAHGQLASRAGIPKQYYDRIREGYPQLWEDSVNTLHPVPALFRVVRTDDGDPILRAVLSDKYDGGLDNVDILTTFLRALSDSGMSADNVVVSGDLVGDTGRLCMRVHSELIAVAARELVASYRSPFNGRTGQELPMMFAGIELTNDETGGSAFSIRPRAVLQVCTNGLTRDVAGEMFRRVHLGARLDEGIISWSEDTRRKQLEFVASSASDAIRTFMSPEYLRKLVDEASAARGIEVTNPTESIERVAKIANLSDDEATLALNDFIRGGDLTVLGLGHAVTSIAQRVDDSERQSDLEQSFWKVLDAGRALVAA